MVLPDPKEDTMNIGEALQRDVDAAKSLFHAVEHKLVLDGREAFHEAHVLADSLEAKIVELGKATGATQHIEEAVNALKPVLAALAAHVAAIVEPEVSVVEAAVDSVVHAVEAPVAPAADLLPPVVPAADPGAEATGPIVVPIAANHADVTA